MSGRDLRQFLTERAGSFNVKPLNAHLVHSYATGSLRKHETKGTDYNKLDALVEHYKQSGEMKAGKVKSLAKKSTVSKETMMLKQHKEVWLKEKEKLDILLKKTELELESFYGSAMLTDEVEIESQSPTQDVWKKAVETEGRLITERETFYSDHVRPLLHMQGKLESYCKLYHQKVPDCSDDEKAEKLKRDLAIAKENQNTVQLTLRKALRDTEAALSSGKVFDIISAPSDDRIVRMSTIPGDLYQLDCPDEEIRRSVIEQFDQLSSYHKAVLTSLDEMYSEVNDVAHGGWSEEDSCRFSLILEQYPADLPGRRKLYIDRLSREIPHKSRADILQHERWVESLRYYQQRKEACFRSWTRDKDDLLLRAKVLFRDALEGEKAAVERERKRENQQSLCYILHKKLSVWMEQKLEAMRLEASIAEMIQKEEKKKREALEAKEKEHREKNKMLLEAHRIKKEAEHQKALEDKQKRLLDLEMALSEQAQHDRERVKYREEQRQHLLEENRVKHVQAEQAEAERQHRLEVLRQQVRIEAPVDPLRLLRETKAYQSRLLSTQSEDNKELPLQTPLFSQCGYTDQQIKSDKRVRVEVALRKAGLHGSEYARKILAAVPPPTEPRRDLQSTVFKNIQ